MSEDLAHDAHLRAALRHAPDHALSPPSGLTQTILAAARQAHRGAPATPVPPPTRMRPAGEPSLHGWMQRMLSPRWAGAWAVVLVVALGLGLWLDLELRPVVEHPAVVASNGTAPVAPAVNEAPRVTAPSEPSADTRMAEASAKPAPVTPQREAALAAPRVRSAIEPARSGDGAPAQPRETAAAVPIDATPPPVARAAAPAAMPDVAAAPDPRRDETTPEVKRADTIAAAPAARGAEQRVSAAGALREQLALRSMGKAEADPTRAAPTAVSAASPASALLRRAQGELSAGRARWTWVAPGRLTIAPFDEDAQAWLSRVAQAAQDRWSETGERGEPRDAIEARWWRDGWPQATLRIEADGLRWIEGERIRHAPLDAAALHRLRSF
ncbi:MAG TPA: hypothetical protein VLE45_02420 [Burkholderiaceae bacterium]|nr:hypothetical protein [Burkholderiaceae bacterium]